MVSVSGSSKQRDMVTRFDKSCERCPRALTAWLGQHVVGLQQFSKGFLELIREFG